MIKRNPKRFRSNSKQKPVGRIARPVVFGYQQSEIGCSCNLTYPGQTEVSKSFGPLLPQQFPENFDDDFYKLFIKFNTALPSFDDGFTYGAGAWTLKFGFTYDNVISAPPKITQEMRIRVVVKDWDPDTITQANMPRADAKEIIVGETSKYDTSSFVIMTLNTDYEMFTDRLDLLNAVGSLLYTISAVVSPTVFDIFPFPSDAPAVNALVGKRICSNYDTLIGFRTIVSNTASQITIDSAFDSLPLAFQTLSIEQIIYGACLYTPTSFIGPYPQLTISNPRLVRHSYA